MAQKDLNDEKAEKEGHVGNTMVLSQETRLRQG